MSKKIISLFIAVLLILLMLPYSVFAEQTGTYHESVTVINPLYEGLITEDDLFAGKGRAASPKLQKSAAVFETDAAVVSAQLREAMKNRENTVTLYYFSPYYSEDKNNENSLGSIASRIFKGAVSHTGVPDEGDSLMWVYGGYYVEGNISGTPGGYNMEITFTIPYYTSAAQEAELSAEIDELFTYFRFNETTTEYAKIRTIYDYICKNITYDNANLHDSSYLLKFTAYAALVNKTAVCQGYAILFYNMCLKAGVDCRIITGIGGTGTVENHAWNIVEINNIFYYVDSTWDAGVTAYSYFLKGSTSSFSSSHEDGDDYKTKEFTSAYPISESNYPSFIGHSHTQGTKEVAGGYLVSKCTSCGATALGAKPASLTLSSISVTTLPDKVNYLESKDTLDVTGGKVTLNYDGNIIEIIDMTADMVTGFDNSVVGARKLTVTYGGKTAEFNVNITAKALSSISVSTKPTKDTYDKDADLLSTEGGKLTLTYDNGTSKIIDMTADMVSGFDNSVVGEQTLTVTYGGKTATFTVTVIHRFVSEIALTAPDFVDIKASVQLTAVSTPSNASVIWSVEAGTGTASIDQSGRLTALTEGTVTVIATADDEGGVFAEKELLLLPAKAETATLSVTAINVAEGVYTDVYVSISDDTNASDIEFTLNYNPDILFLLFAEPAGVLNGNNLPDITYGTGTDTETVSFSWTDDGTKLIDSGKILVLRFKVLDVSEDSVVPITFSASRSVDGYTADTLSVVDGSMKVYDTVLGDVASLDSESGTNVNVADVNCIRQYSAHMLTLDEKKLAAADVNGDGKVNVIDANYIRRYAVGNISKLPVSVVQKID